MSGICGWINWGDNHGEYSRVLSEMAGCLSTSKSEAVRRACGNGSGLVAVGDQKSSDLYSDGKLWVACHGSPYWDSSSRYEAISRPGMSTGIAKAYLEQGPTFLEHLKGAFSVAIIDPESRTALLAIDRIGIHTLCYGIYGDTLVFGTNCFAVRAHPRADDEFDPQGIFNYVNLSAVPAPRTIYLRQKKLQGAQCVLFGSGETKEHFYWALDYYDGASVKIEDLEDEFRQLTRKTVRRAASNGKVGAFLSGGTDSSTVCGTLAEIRGEPIDAYSIGFDMPGYDEMEYARIAAHHFNLRHHVYYVTPQDVLEGISLIAAAYDEPFGNESAVGVHCCARAAREDGMETLLAGDGGDEIFAGNPWYAKQKLFEAYQLVPELMRQRLLEPLIARVPTQTRLFPLRKLKSYVDQAKVPLPDRIWSPTSLGEEAFEPDFLSKVVIQEPIELIREAYFGARSNHPVDRMLHLDLKIISADSDLRKVNRMCELTGVGVNYPFLDDEMIEFSGRIPPKWKVKGFNLRYLFKKALRDFLPREILVKKKQGFGVPFGLWLAQDTSLKAFARESLSSLETRGIIRPDYVEALRHRHETVHSKHYGVLIWNLMILEQWIQQNTK